MSDTILAIDLGGTHCRAGLAPLSDPASVQPLGDWPAPPSRDAFVALLSQQVRANHVTHLGIGIPGLANGTICRWVPNLPYLDGLDLAEAFPGATIGLGNDAQLALLAEVSAGAARGLDDVILLAIGTGIGSAVLAGGRIVAGSNGGACSFGWAAADLDDPGEDRNGWLERQASGRALDSIAQAMGLDSGTALVDAARSGRADARAALAVPMHAVGTTLAGAVARLDPAAVIIAGGVASSFDVLAPLILDALQWQLPPHLRNIDLRPGQFGPRAGLVGAAFAGAHGSSWRHHNG